MVSRKSRGILINSSASVEIVFHRDRSQYLCGKQKKRISLRAPLHIMKVHMFLEKQKTDKVLL